MTRITEKLSLLKDNKKTALIPFITAGDPDKASTVPLLHTLVNNGADIIEIGVPFSDPMADGPVIQRASERALVNEITIHDILEIVEEFRSVDNNTPIVLMGYLNPIEAMGYQEFAIKSNLSPGTVCTYVSLGLTVCCLYIFDLKPVFPVLASYMFIGFILIIYLPVAIINFLVLTFLQVVLAILLLQLLQS
mgnify:CR=1 FL=1